jgi:uncharacterized membrane protein YheB (UPF0754 family)
MALNLNLEDRQKKLIDEIFAANDTLKASREKLNNLRDALNDTWTNDQRNAILENPNEMFQLDGYHHTIAISEEEKNRVADIEYIVSALTKKQLPQVISVVLQKLEEGYPKVYEKAIKREPTGSRKIYMLKDKINDFGY